MARPCFQVKLIFDSDPKPNDAAHRPTNNEGKIYVTNVTQLGNKL